MGWCRPSVVLLVVYYLLLYVPSYKNSTIDVVSRCGNILHPPRCVFRRPLMVENIFPYTAMGTPLSSTRAARAAILARIFRQCRRVSVTLFKISKYIVTSTPNWSFPPSNYGRRNFRHLPHEQITGNRACRLGQAAGTGGKSTSWFSFFSFCSLIISGPLDL